MAEIYFEEFLCPTKPHSQHTVHYSSFNDCSGYFQTFFGRYYCHTATTVFAVIAYLDLKWGIKLYKKSFLAFPVMSVKGVNFGHMSKLRLPSEAATASENWANFTNRVEIPSLDLMEHMQQGGDAQIIFLSFKSLHALLPPPQDNQEKDLR